MYQTLQTSLEGGVYQIIINRPEKMNALNRQVMEDLSKAVTEIYENDNIRSAIITGAGNKAFVAGADISEFSGLSSGEGMDLARTGQEIFARIENSPKPIVAAVNGFALGGGCELAMACHFRLASPNAKFGQPEVNLGLIPGYGGTQRLVHLIGKGRAIELLITGNMINAETALQYGLVNHVVPQEELLAKTRAILELVHTKAPLAVAGCIKCANVAITPIAEGMTVRHGYSEEVNVFGDCFSTEDVKEGTEAFLAKRQPEFKGK